MNRGNGGYYQQQLNARQLVSYIGGNWGASLNYNHDALGRVTSIDSPDNSYDRSFYYDNAGRLATAYGTWGTGSYNHDGKGNVSNDGLHSFSYDAANQPISISGTDNGSFTYDGNLKHVKQTIDGKTVYSIYDRSGALLTRDDVTAGQVTDFITLAGQTFVRITNGTPNYPLNDHLGSAYMVANASGGISASYQYTPFGETLGADLGTNNQSPPTDTPTAECAKSSFPSNGITYNRIPVFFSWRVVTLKIISL